MNVKVRPSILIISLGLVTALVLTVVGIIKVIAQGASVELLAAFIAFGGTITTALVSVASKMMESEEATK